MSQGSTRTSHPTQSEASAPSKQLSELEARFVENWAGLARSFGMDPILGRVHALSFVRHEGVHAHVVGEALGLMPLEAARNLEELSRWGLVHRSDSACGALYLADGDPWSWFMVALRERGRREFGPLLESIREAHACAEQVRRSLAGATSPDARAELRGLERIAKFTQFVEQIASLLETFAHVGAAPIMGALRMAAKLRGPKLMRA